MEYIKLKDSYSKNGFDYDLIDRKKDVCIYAQKSDGKLTAFEVFKVNKNEARDLYGKHYEPSESVPPTTQWGHNAFTVHTIEQALSKQAELISHMLVLETR